MTDIMRRHPRELSEFEQDQIERIKDLGERLWEEYERSLHHVADGRAIAIAKTHLETSVLWAVKGVSA